MAVYCYDQNHINTDLLFPGKYTCTCGTGPETAPHLLEGLDPEFAGKVKPGDIIMAGSNFGCGSSREQAALGLRYSGVQAVIAKSFARIFYRSSINQGLLLIQSPEAVDHYKPGDEVSVNAVKGTLTVGDKEFSFPPLPEQMIKVLEAGGLLNWIKENYA